MKVNTSARSTSNTTPSGSKSEIKIEVRVNDIYVGDIDIFIASGGVYESFCNIPREYEVVHTTVLHEAFGKAQTSTIVSIAHCGEVCTNFVNLG